MSAASVLQANARVMQLRECTIYGMAIDPQQKFIVSASDFGHIFIHRIDSDGTDTKTLQSQYAPFNSLHFTASNGMSLVFCGGTRWICCWKWEDLLNCAGPAAPDPFRVYNCVQNFRMPVAAQHMAAVDVNSIDSDFQSTNLYAGCGDGIVYQLDCQTGQTVNCFTGHDNFVHKVKVLGLATQSAPKVLSCDDGGAILQYDPRCSSIINRCNVQGELQKLKLAAFSNRRFWCGSLDVDESENFLYAGGGIESRSGTASLGWAAVCHIGAEGGAQGSVIRGLCATPLPSPVQELILQGEHVVCGGSQASIRFLSSTSLDVVSYSPVSTLSVFSMAATKKSEKKLLGVGGTHPIVDVFSMRGGRPRSFIPQGY